MQQSPEGCKVLSATTKLTPEAEAAAYERYHKKACETRPVFKIISIDEGKIRNHLDQMVSPTPI